MLHLMRVLKPSEVIAQNEQDNPQHKDVEGPLDQEIIKVIQEEGVQDGQINHQPTEEALENNIKALVPITETSVPEAHQSQDTNHASTSSYPIA
uniref:Uncharacterized protein n=1 Tax=Tanacetum cinerariifolium TaxID=118510 RepID=A0A699QLK1_TANCI|nr:hypothetical protein [Tanacetum cinerariifolium]